MKKYFLVVFCALLLFVVTGCGDKKNQLKCTGSMSEGGVDMKAEIIADFDESDKLTDATIVYDLGSSETANQWCTLMQMMQDESKGIKVSCSGSKITITGYAKMDDEDEEESMIGKTKEEFKTAMAAEQITCK